MVLSTRVHISVFDSGWEVRIRILRKCVYRCTGTIGTHSTFILMCTVRIVKNNYLHHWESLAMLLFVNMAFT